MRCSAISHDNRFSLLAIDALTELAERSGINMQQPSEIKRLEHTLTKVVKECAGFYSGVLLSPDIGYNALFEKKDSAGVVFPLERRLFDADPLSIPILKEHWGVAAIAQNYGVAKLELFYHPEEKEAITKQQIVAELYDYCKHENIDLILELILYIEGTEAEYTAQLPGLQLRAVKEFRSLCSLLALEYPLNALNTVTLTAELDIPWILTARTTPYEIFKEQLRTALESGAVGYMGSSFFFPPMPEVGQSSFSQEELEDFIIRTGKDRVAELYRIVSGS